jgi:hypothetical protein
MPPSATAMDLSGIGSPGFIFNLNKINLFFQDENFLKQLFDDFSMNTVFFYMYDGISGFRFAGISL